MESSDQLPAVGGPATLTPRERVAAAIEERDLLDHLKRNLLDPRRHVIKIRGKDAINSAGWDTIATHLRISVKVLSVGADGRPGAHRQVLEDLKGERFITYSATVQAARTTPDGQEVVREMTGRTSSDERSMAEKAKKGALTEDFLEAMSVIRAKNRAICALLGGNPSDVAEDAQEYEPKPAPEKQALGWSALLGLAQSRRVVPRDPAAPAIFLAWCKANVPSTEDIPLARRHFTREEALRIQELLEHA